MDCIWILLQNHVWLDPRWNTWETGWIEKTRPPQCEQHRVHMGPPGPPLSQDLIIVQDYCDGGDLAHYIFFKKKSSELIPETHVVQWSLGFSACQTQEQEHTRTCSWVTRVSPLPRKRSSPTSFLVNNYSVSPLTNCVLSQQVVSPWILHGFYSPMVCLLNSLVFQQISYVFQ